MATSTLSHKFLTIVCEQVCERDVTASWNKTQDYLDSVMRALLPRSEGGRFLRDQRNRDAPTMTITARLSLLYCHPRTCSNTSFWLTNKSCLALKSCPVLLQTLVDTAIPKETNTCEELWFAWISFSWKETAAWNQDPVLE